MSDLEEGPSVDDVAAGSDDDAIADEDAWRAFAAELPDGPDGAYVEYELDAWAGESRQLLQQLLTGEGIAQAWEGARLVVPERFEEAVDALVEQVEVTTLPTLDPEAPKDAFTLTDWSDAQVENLMERLDAAGIPFEFDVQRDLIVLASDADAVEVHLEAIEFPDALDTDDDPDDSDDADDGLVDIDPDRVLGGLFVACDRLVRHPDDPKGWRDALDAADVLGTARAPYGFDPRTWEAITGHAADLAKRFDSGITGEDELVEAATDLRELLRPLV